MVERRMGRGRVPERSSCSGADCANGGTHFDCAFDATADFHDGAFAIFAVAGDGRITLWDDGIGARHQRSGHEYQSDGAGTAAVYGACPEYFLFLWHFFTGGAGAGGGLGRIADQPGGRVWDDCRSVCGCFRQRLLAYENTASCGCGGGLGSREPTLTSKST